MIAASWSLGDVTLLDPWFLLAFPVALLAALWRWRRPRAALPTGDATLFDGLPRTLRQRFAWLPQFGKLLAAACLALALARPVEREVVPLQEQGIDIVLVIDTSSSMNLEDMDEKVSVRRIEAARLRAAEFAAARMHDRVGLVTFARFAELRCPPTLDEQALAAFLAVVDTVKENSELDATAIGTALAKAVAVLEKSKAKSKVVVLLTDGQNNVQDILPGDAAKLAKDAGIRVHAIGLGHGQATIFGFQPLDFTELRKVAETTGGQFFQPKTDQDLAEVYARIDELEKSEIEDPRFRMVDRFTVPLAAGLAALLAALLVEVLWFRRLP